MMMTKTMCTPPSYASAVESFRSMEMSGKCLGSIFSRRRKIHKRPWGLIGKMLGVQPKSFGFSGTKDKRSVSTQCVTVLNQQASKLAALNKRLFGVKAEGLLFVQLMGNRLTTHEEEWLRILKKLSKSLQNPCGKTALSTTLACRCYRDEVRLMDEIVASQVTMRETVTKTRLTLS